MIKPFVDIAGGSKAVELTQNLKAIGAANQRLAATIQGILGMTVADFGPAAMDLTASTQITIPHGLGYTPVFLAYFYSPSISQYIPLPVIDYGSAFTGLQSRPPATVLTAWADNLNLYIKWVGAAQQPNQQFYYFICKAQIGGS